MVVTGVLTLAQVLTVSTAYLGIRNEVIKLKKTIKFSLIFLTVFVVLLFSNILVVYAASGQEIVEDTRSSFQVFWDGFIKPKLLDAAFQSAVLSAIVAIVLNWLKKSRKKLEQVGKQYGLTNEQMLSIINYLKNNVVKEKLDPYILTLMNALEQFDNWEKRIDQFMQAVDGKIALLVDNQETISKMLKLAYTNDKELVRLGVAKEISKLANKQSKGEKENAKATADKANSKTT